VANDPRRSGTATGTTNWSVSGIVLQRRLEHHHDHGARRGRQSATGSSDRHVQRADTTNPAVAIDRDVDRRTSTCDELRPMSVSGTASDNAGCHAGHLGERSRR
jgi:hypothetical protein